jgi:deoxyribose-phosphate aldolase
MDINSYIDHTNLNAFASIQDIIKLCDEAKQYKFCSVCVNPFFVSVAKRLLKGSGVKVCTVIGFPLGANTPKIKALEARQAVQDGADEVDMVQNISMAKEHDFDYISAEVREVKNAVGENITLKVILETCYLSKGEIRECAKAAVKGGADFVKTSTGFGKGGATPEDVRIMREAVGPYIGVKASGGIHTRKEAMELLAAGANRLGCSHSVAIMKEN